VERWLGADPEKEAKVIEIEKTQNENSKCGRSVKKVKWEDTFVVSLDNDHWAYSYQLRPVTETK
jgi:hypothetical protein